MLLTVRAPVEGLNFSLVELVFTALFPEVADTIVG